MHLCISTAWHCLQAKPDFYCCKQEFEDLQCFMGWPILPTEGGVASLTALQASALVWVPDTEGILEPARSALRKLGIR